MHPEWRVFDQEEPIPSPGNIAGHGPKIRHEHGDACRVPIAGYIFNRHASIWVQCGADNSDRRLNAVFPRADSTQMGQSRHHADCAMSAHSQVTYIVEEENASGAAGVHRIAEQRTHQHIRTPWLVDHRGPEIVVFRGKPPQPIGHRIVAQRWPSTDDYARRLPGCVRIDNLNR